VRSQGSKHSWGAWDGIRPASLSRLSVQRPTLLVAMKRPATARSRSKDSYASNESGGLSLQNGAAGSGIGNSDGSSSPKRIGMRRASGSAMVALAAAKKWNQSSRTAAHGSGASATPRAVRFSSNKGVSDVGLSALTAQATLHPSFFQHGDAANLQSSGGVEASAASNSQLSEALAKLGNVFTLSDLVEAGVLSQSRAMQYASEKVGNSARAMIKGGLPENTDDEPCTPVPFNKDRVLTIWDLSDLICRKDFRAWGVAEVKPPTTGEAQESKRASVRGSIRGSHRGSLLKAGNLGKGEEPVNADGGSSLSSSGDSSGSGSEHQNDEEVSETLRRISLFQLPSQYRGAGKVSRGAALWKRGALKISVAAAMRGSSKDTLPPSDDQSSSPVGTPGSKGVRNSLLDMVKNAPSRGSGSSPSSARRSLKPGEPGSPHKEPGTQKSPRGAAGKRVTTFPRGESPSQSSDRSPSPAGSPKVPPPPPPVLAPAPPRGERPRHSHPPVEGAFVLEACGGLDSERNPQVQMEAARLTWVRMDLEVQGKCGPTIQMWVLHRSRWGLRRPKITNIITKAETVGNRVGPRQLRCEFELQPGEVSTTVICCSAADNSPPTAQGEENSQKVPFQPTWTEENRKTMPEARTVRVSIEQPEVIRSRTDPLSATDVKEEPATNRSESKQAAEDERKKKGKKDEPKTESSSTKVATFKLFITTTLPFARAPILLDPRKPVAPRRSKSPKGRLKKMTTQKLMGQKGAPKGPFDRRSPFRTGSSCPICSKGAHHKDNQESNKGKSSKSGSDNECAVGCCRRCLCWCREAPQAGQQKPQSPETAPSRQSIAAETAASRQAAKAITIAEIELFSAKCTEAAENLDDKVCRFIEDTCASYSRNTQLFFNTEAKSYLLSHSREGDAAIVGFAKRAALATGLQARHAHRRLQQKMIHGRESATAKRLA